jgi:hypothetical protein
MPTFLFAFVLYYLPAYFIGFPVGSRWLVLVLIFFTTFLIPGVGAYFIQRMGYLDSLEMDRREQRRIPLLFTGTCYAVTSYLLYREPVFDQLFYTIMGIIAASVFLTYIISLFWKVSAHGMGMGGTLGLLLLINKAFPEAFLFGPIIFFIMMTGVVLSARLALNAHTPAQVYTGFCSGLLLSLVAGIISF